jgi:hypothetical protein
MMHRLTPWFLLCTMSCLLSAGCTSGGSTDELTSQSDVASPPDKEKRAPESPAGTAETKTYTDENGLKTLIAPFTPPKLEELEKSVEWVDKPVIDAMKLLEEYRRRQPTPIDDQAALRLRNDASLARRCSDYESHLLQHRGRRRHFRFAV